MTVPSEMNSLRFIHTLSTNLSEIHCYTNVKLPGVYLVHSQVGSLRDSNLVFIFVRAGRGVTRQRRWLRRYATSRNVARSNSNYINFISIYLILPVALWSWGLLSLQQKWVPGIFLGVRLTNSPPSMSPLSENVGSSTYHNPIGLHALLQR
jgi:hypothetical protein